MSTRAPSRFEFVALMAMLVSTVAFSIDAMLPALPRIAAELSPDAPNRAQLILTAFFVGLGLGTFLMGPLSDRFGRKPVILWGLALYIAGAGLAWAAPTLELLLLARLVQGFGAAAPRVVSLAIIRDLHSGRAMARLVSFVMLIFTLVPAVAPLLGTLIMQAGGGWRTIFAGFLVFATISGVWLMLRLAETLPASARRPLRPRPMLDTVAEMFRHPTVRLSIAVQTLCYAMLFMSIAAIQPVFDQAFGRGESFPYWFAGIALVAGSASLLNATLVMRLGMRRLVTFALSVQCGVTLAVLLYYLGAGSSAAGFLVFVGWQATVFFMVGMTLGNLNAIAMEPMGHVAGMAASVIGSVSSVLAAAIAVPIGLAFDGTPVPLAAGVLAVTAAGYGLMLHMGRVERGLPA